MRQNVTQHSVSLIFLCCLLLLVVSSVFLIPRPPAHIPPTLTLEYRNRRFSTESATLMTPESEASFSRPNLFSQSTPHPFNETLVRRWVRSIAPQIDTPPISPSIRIDANKNVSILPGKTGVSLLVDQTARTLLQTNFVATDSAMIQARVLGKELSPSLLQSATTFASQFVGKTLTITGPHMRRDLESGDIFALLDLPTSFSSEAIADLGMILDNSVSTTPIEPELTLVDTVVQKFIAPRDGRQVDLALFQSQLREKLELLAHSPTVDPLPLQFVSIHPKTSLQSLNTLGINERIGLGESAYAHSIPNRIHNVSLTTSRIHAKLILPGDEFSFNAYLGEVSGKTGFKPAYVIKQGQTVLGDGGGVCQVSSTLFRAVLNSGLPITERKGHSYRVSYYEENSKPGFDATVYSPHPDFRFINDTGHAILINAVADPKTLSMYIELWGTSDGRKAEIQNYRQWGASSAPPPVYQDDPTLPPGKLKQIDYAAPGLKTAFEYVVTYPDETIKTTTYTTTYTPWRAVYLRGI